MLKHRFSPIWIACAMAGLPYTTWAADFLPETLRRVVAYDGPPRAREEVAILFTMDGRPNYESATICDVDGVSLERDGVCASVVHVLPGRHRLKLRYSSPTQFGTGQTQVDAEANRLYQINLSSLRINYAALVSVIPMPAGAKLTWRQIAPGLAKGSPRVDEAVPDTPNSERGQPVVAPPLSEADQQRVERLLGCAGTFAVDIERRKNSHEEYESRFGFVGAFTRAAADYIGEEDAISRALRAQQRGTRTYTAALSPGTAGSEASREAQSRLAAELLSCTEFYQTLPARPPR